MNSEEGKGTGLVKAREETRRYHDEYYRRHALFEEGSWLQLPDKSLCSIISEMAHVKGARALDLGCGVGRNAIPLAEAGVHVTCIDCLPVAVELLNENARRRKVEKFISAFQQPIEEFCASPGTFDLVLAISVL